MSSANKLFKESGSDLPFKEWLKREQLKGNLDVHKDKFLNADGDDDTPAELTPENSILITTATKNKTAAFIIGVVAGMLISKYVFKK